MEQEPQRKLHTPSALRKAAVDLVAKPSYDLAEAHGITGVDVNAIAHALTSANIAYRTNRPFARFMGDLKEGAADLIPIDTMADSWKDQWNNEVGRRIAGYARRHHLPASCIGPLVVDAYRQGELLNTEKDPRVQLGQAIEPTWSMPSLDWRQYDLKKTGAAKA